MITTNAVLNNNVGWSQTDTGSGESNTKDTVSLGQTVNLVDGSGTGQINTVWLGTGTLGLGGQELLDLYSLSRAMFGQSIDISFTSGTVKSIFVSNTSTGTSQTLKLSNTGANDMKGYSDGQSATILVYPGSSLSLVNQYDGYTVDASNRYLRVVDSGNGSTYKIGITGVV